MKQHNSTKFQKGFFNQMLLAGVAIMGVIGAYYMQSMVKTTKNTTRDEASMAAGTINNQLTALLNGAETFEMNGGAMSTLTMDNNGSTGLYNAANGGLVKPAVPVKALETTTELWRYNNNVKIKDLGNDASADYVFTLTDVKEDVCQQVNKALHGTADDAAPAASGATLAAWQTGAVDMSTGIVGIDGKPYNCVGTSDSKFVVYGVAVVN